MAEAAPLLQMLMLMAAAHALADFVLQPAHMSLAKRPGGNPNMPWPVALGAHSLIHGGAVAMITGLWWLGVAETAAHGAIDFGKCRRWYGFEVDQGLHAVCKLAWVAVVVVANG